MLRTAEVCEAELLHRKLDEEIRNEENDTIKLKTGLIIKSPY